MAVLAENEKIDEDESWTCRLSTLVFVIIQTLKTWLYFVVKTFCFVEFVIAVFSKRMQDLMVRFRLDLIIFLIAFLASFRCE